MISYSVDKLGITLYNGEQSLYLQYDTEKEAWELAELLDNSSPQEQNEIIQQYFD